MPAGRIVSCVLAGVLPVAVLAAAPALGEDAKGPGRLEGRVLDADGKPVEGASVKLARRAGGGGTSVETDAKGRWTVDGLATGTWSVDAEAAGLTARTTTVTLTAQSPRLAALDIKLERAAPPGPSREVLTAVSKGDAAFTAGRYAEARAEYEKLLALRPDLGVSLHELIARCYSQEGNPAKAVEHLQALIDADPKNQETRLRVAQEALRGGLMDKGLELLKGLDESQIKNPEIYYSVAAILINQKKLEEALVYLDKTVALEPGYVDAYFQRGLTYLQLKRLAEGKADLQRVIELAPNSRPAERARRFLEELK